MDDLYIQLASQPTSTYVCAAQPPNGYIVKFSPLLKGTTAEHGVTVDTGTGEITVARGGKVGSFLVQATVTDTTVTESGKHPTKNSPPIRVYVHNSVTRFWLTPSELTIKKSATPQHFSALVEFSDGVIADVTCQKKFSWEFVENPEIGTIQPTDDYNYAEKTNKRCGDIQIAVETGSAIIEAQLPAHLGNLKSRATVHASPPWTVPVEAVWVDGAGPDRTEFVKNVLFLPDGFLDTQTDRDAFAEIVSEAVSSLRRSAVTTPYNYLFFSFNFWRAFIPSRQHGTPVLCDLIESFRMGSELYAGDIIRNKKPPDDEWKLEHLLYEVGLPFPADSTADFQTKNDAWPQVYPNIKSTSLSSAVFDEWKALSKHFLANEQDTVFGMRWGGRPCFSGEASKSEVGWNQRRASRADLDQLLAKLTNIWNAQLNNLWVSNGKDQYHVVVLCSGGKRGGTRWPGKKALIAAGLAGTRTVKLDTSFNVIDERVYAHPWLSVFLAHEISHALGLDDEYGGKGRAEDFYYSNPNVQGKETLLVENKLEGNNIKWLWPRMAKIGELLNPPKVTGTYVLLKLRANQAEAFRVNDVVRLRLPYGAPLTPGEMYVIDRLRNPSKEYLQIRSVNSEDDVIEAEVVPTAKEGPATTPLDSYPPGSLIYLPVTKPAGASPLDPDSECTLVHSAVVEHITSTGGPLNAPATDAKQECNQELKGEEARAPQHATNWPKAISSVEPVWSYYLVGLYEGGDGYNCGVYHPTGTCIMRTPQHNEGMVHFCPVCRYFLVDIIDPTLHPLLDAWYSRRYPTS